MAIPAGRICPRFVTAFFLFWWVTSLTSMARQSPSASSSNVTLLVTGKNNTVVISAAFPSLTVQPCLICMTSSKENCTSRLQIDANKSIYFRFNCTDPQNYYKIEIQKFVDCMSYTNYSRTVNFEPSNLPQLNRTFIWRLKAATRIGLDFTFNAMLKQLAPNETCPGNVPYNIRSLNSKTVNIGTFCTGGSVSRVRIQGGAELTMEVPHYIALDTPGFSVTSGMSIRICTDLQSCHVKNLSLYQGIKKLNLPLPLDEVTWKLTAPEECSVELTSRHLKLHQHTKEKPCSNTRYYMRSFIDELQLKPSFGIFCPNGSIEKIQVKKNATVVLNTLEIVSSDVFAHHDLSVSFVRHLQEEYIFVVSPKSESVTYLLTPSGELGMPPLTSASWSVLVPPEQVALLKFIERASVTCQFQHVSLIIKEQTPDSYEIHRREDEPLPDSLKLYNNFWVNISNCLPENGTLDLKLLLQVTKRSGDRTLIIALAAVAAFLILLAAVITICCIKKRKKTADAPPVGIYNAGISTAPPTRAGQFPKGRKDNESHIYAVIDDAMVYGHLLKTADSPIPEVDVYRPFDGKMGDVPPTPPLPLFRKGIQADNVEEDCNIPLKDNDLYTFTQHKKTGPQGNGETISPLLGTAKANC
ncbi:CUB domain-containing protein 1 [Protopterus annectens]|uniref:CUB domain-containing protein 1 n=1 Tax=Protopterus annectens TaxID=7888 RepID=UPI001CFC2E5B|nr:CUB domain-containing protein 1 [Protopterus annectens]